MEDNLKINVPNRVIFNRDNIDILQGINSNSVDLIYLDPPFNTKKSFTAPIGSSAEGASFKDIFYLEDIKDEWLDTIKLENTPLYNFLLHTKTDGINHNYCYLTYLSIRLVECYRILKPTGSIYLHCDHTMSHYLKVTMDSIFGQDNFRNEIVWKRTEATKSSSKKYSTVTDSILFYSKTKNIMWTDLRAPAPVEGAPPKAYVKDDSGRYYRKIDIVALPAHGGNSPMYTYKGFTPKTRWLYTKDKIEEMDRKGLLVFSASGRPYKKQYWDDHPGNQMGNFWADIKGAGHMPTKERTGYPTQKPLALLERIIEASSNEGDFVLDPFCGCATTCVAAEKLNRNWGGIDISHKAYDLVRQRLDKEISPMEKIYWNREVIFSTTAPKRTDAGIADNIDQGYIYVISHPVLSAAYGKEANGAGEKSYKVGITKDFEKRLANYQTHSPGRDYKEEYKVLTPKYKSIEKAVFERFSSDRKNEWVLANKNDIIDVIKGML